MPIRFVLFDIGGVLCDVDLDRARRRCLELGYEEAVYHAVEASGAKLGGDRGSLDIAGMLAAVRGHAEAARALTEADLVDFWGAVVRWRPYVPWLIEHVTVPYGVLSVIDPIHAKALGPLQGADPLVYSYEIAALKPHPLAYTAAIDRCPVPPEDIRFIDDRADNVAAAREAGIDAHQVTDLATIKKALAPVLRD